MGQIRVTLTVAEHFRSTRIKKKFIAHVSQHVSKVPNKRDIDQRMGRLKSAGGS